MNKIEKNKKKRKIVWLLLLFLFLFSFSFSFTIKYFYEKIDNETFLRILLEGNNSYIEKKDNPKVLSNFLSFLSNVSFNNPKSLLNINYVIKDYDSSSDEEKDIDTLPSSNYVKDPYPDKDYKDPIIYLYNTHQSEEYTVSSNESYNVKPTVMMASYILREKLNKEGITTIVEENDVTEFLRTNNWNYASSYKVTRLLMEDAYEKNSSLEYFIDLHRDSVKKSISSVTINNINYAKILFIVGLENSNYQKNLAFTSDLNDRFNEKYPGLSRGIYKKQGPGVNGVYNQDFSPNTILIEIGGEANTIDEVYNTCNAISEVLIEYIKEKEL